MKRVAILQTGVNNPQLSASYPDYPGMFRILVGQQQTTPNIELISFPVLEGAFLPDIEKFDGFIITGSASGVYEDTEWMRGLFAFIRDAEKAKKKISAIHKLNHPEANVFTNAASEIGDTRKSLTDLKSQILSI